MSIPLRRPKVCSCGREYQTVPESATVCDGGHTWWHCVCGSTLTQPSLRFEHTKTIVAKCYERCDHDTISNAVLHAMMELDIYPHDNPGVYEDAVDTLTRRLDHRKLYELFEKREGVPPC